MKKNQLLVLAMILIMNVQAFASLQLLQALELASVLPKNRTCHDKMLGSWKNFDILQKLPIKTLPEDFAPFQSLIHRSAQASIQKIDIKGVPISLLSSINQGACSGGSWTCGFHAIKNVLYVLNALQELTPRIPGQRDDAIVARLQNCLTSKDYFEHVFLNGGTIQKPGPRSWLEFAKTIHDFRAGDRGGIYPGDQRLLLQNVYQEKLIVPHSIHAIKSLIPFIYPIDALVFKEIQDMFAVIQAIYRLRSNQEVAVGFTLAPSTQAAHFVGVVLYKTTKGLEVFVVDSLNRPLVYDGQLIDDNVEQIKELIDWYQDFDTKIVNYINSSIGDNITRYLQRVQSNPVQLLGNGFIDTLRQMFRTIQMILLAQVVINDNTKFDTVKKNICILINFYKDHALHFDQSDSEFKHVDSSGDREVNVYRATDGILPRTGKEFIPMLRCWSAAIGC